jgi:starvation-inducible DNA-binding protein
MYQTKNDLAENVRQQLVDLLNACLADAIDLRLQIKQAQWNVKGPNFSALHILFEQIASRVDTYIDLIADRTTALGGTALGALQVVAKASTLAAYPIDISAGREHVDALATALAAFGRLARASIDRAAAVLGDIDTGAVFTDVSRGIDSDLGLLEAHVQAER